LARTFGPVLAGLLYRHTPSLPFLGCAALNIGALAIALGMRHIQPAARSTEVAADPEALSLSSVRPGEG
jgi:hypothetical protein